MELGSIELATKFAMKVGRPRQHVADPGQSMVSLSALYFAASGFAPYALPTTFVFADARTTRVGSACFGNQLW